MAEAVEWQRLATTLRELHRTLVDTTRHEYERAHLVELSPGELLQLLTSNPEFEWLRGLSELMVDLDLVRDFATADDDITTAVRAAVEHLLSNAHAPAGLFAERYWPYVHQDPRVAMAHGAVKQVLAAWPPPQTDTATLLQERHRLAEKARHLAKRK
ncbi:MAG: hypothetical protein ABI547_10835 [Betaproteobacteria bacterium]